MAKACQGIEIFRFFVFPPSPGRVILAPNNERDIARMSDEEAKPPPAGPVDDAPEKPEKVGRPENGGPKGPEPTRYGDWEKKGRCIDF